MRGVVSSNGQLSVWAPSKIVLDAVDAPDADAETPEALALWFAEQFAASKMLVSGKELQSESVEICAIAADDVASLKRHI